MTNAVPVIVDPSWVQPRRTAVTVCDVRWYLDGRTGWDAFVAGHLPGAVFVDLDRWLAGPPSTADGRHPLPPPEVFARGMRDAGIDNGATVVAYDDSGGGTAARLVWMLRACGERAALLDGGLRAWREPLSRVAPVITSGTFTPSAWPSERLADADDVAAAVAAGGTVIDARAAARYRGDTEPVDARAGHIPGAINLPYTGNVDPATHRFLDVGALRDRYRAADVTGQSPPIVYCGSGVTACHALLAMEHTGLDTARLYADSWSQWSADPTRSVATGSDPGPPAAAARA